MSSLSNSGVLTDLCAICHTNQQKYTCPRCGCHTCSLPCVKRHKEWAQCSGVRDPAAYRKRAELETPASIDQDFNFITSVERSLERADDDAADRGIQLSSSVTTSHSRNKRKFESKSRWERDAEARGIRVVKAPVGLSRNKLNKTQWNGNHDCISWSVEWVAQDGTRKLKHFVDDYRTVQEAYDYAFHTAATRKRKRTHAGNAKPNHKDGPTTSLEVKVDGQGPDTAAASAIGLEVKVDNQGQGTAVAPSAATDEVTIDGQGPNTAAVSATDLQVKTDIQGRDTATVSTTDDETLPKPPPSLHFYLQRPLTASKLRCLIPISPDRKLDAVLRGKTVIEFPTIYALDQAVEEQTDKFITEAQYESTHGTDVSVLLSPQDLEEGELVDDDSERVDLPANLDSSKVLEVLQKDLLK